MKKLIAIALLGFATFSFADANLADCTPGTLSDYQKLGAAGCLIGDKKFSNFQYNRGHAGLPGDAISITPGTVPGNDDPGLLFEGKWTSVSKDSFVSYNVEVQPAGKPITGATLYMQLGEITGTGKATVLADLCPADGASDGCGTQKLELRVVLSSNRSKKLQDTIQFRDPQKGIRVITPVDLSTGSGGNASLQGFMEVFR